ncbi:hypothetical protein [Flavobacterium sp. KACC 22763]|uniref:hypothetical protein n=1 Tax=Flavobacterium sp. KACC 22763 TaxID=3025668 RepID=UPI002365ECDA|nr:hypothetical protein [Flavobacterium sp. KACC 22763]WDF65970.1 hypothetical protein PQ463_07305 [Flavobacterium sp. KACC 22763]
MIYKNFILYTLSSFFLFINALQKQESSILYFNNDQEIAGVYVLTSCENSRFKIKIEKKSDGYFFLIFDKNKIISKGKLGKKNEDDTVYLAFGKIGGIYDTDKIQIQNYGNSMNEYVHFTQCDEKYLSFIKSE